MGVVPGVDGLPGDIGSFGVVGVTDPGLVESVGAPGVVGMEVVGLLGTVVVPGEVGLVGVCCGVCAPAKPQTTNMAAS